MSLGLRINVKVNIEVNYITGIHEKDNGSNLTKKIVTDKEKVGVFPSVESFSSKKRHVLYICMIRKREF